MNRASLVQKIAAAAGAVALVATFLLVGQASAVRQVSYTLQPVTSAECIGISIVRQTNGSGGTVLVATFTSQIKDETGAVREVGSSSMQLAPSAASSIGSFVTSVAVPAFNTENNL